MVDGIRITLDMSDYNADMNKLNAALPSIVQKIVKQLATSTRDFMVMRSPVATIPVSGYSGGQTRDTIKEKYPSMMEATVMPTTKYSPYIVIQWDKKDYTRGARKKDRTTNFVEGAYNDVKNEAERLANQILQEELNKL